MKIEKSKFFRFNANIFWVFVFAFIFEITFAHADISFTERFKLTYPQIPKFSYRGFNPYKNMMEPKIFKNYVSGDLEVKHFKEFNHRLASIRDWKAGTLTLVDFDAHEFKEIKLSKPIVPRVYGVMIEPSRCKVKFLNTKPTNWKLQKCDLIELATNCQVKGKESKLNQKVIFCKDLPKELIDFRVKNIDKQKGQGDALIPNFLSQDWKKRLPKEMVAVAKGKYAVKFNQSSTEPGMAAEVAFDVLGDISTKSIDKKIFKVPSGFKKVTELKLFELH